ncbi:MAG: NAD(P)/FAD-dependent oxidoreductase [Nanoarchaeota archaeon]|nr:NAD(P)/FAD-dependent oxidoreductase [Nanoarchaeota archaeon]
MYDTIIIGAGIAGVTSAIYASRKRMNYLFIGKDFGGQLNSSGEVVNYPGIVKTSGGEFEMTLMKQLEFNKVESKTEEVKSIEKMGDNFKVKTNKEEYETQTVIIATGARPRKIGAKGEPEFFNKGLTYCSICDGPLFKGKKVAVIGGGDAGLEAADFLLNIAEDIKIMDVAEKSIAHEYLQERVLGNEKVEYINKSFIKEIYGDEMVKGLKYEREGKLIDLPVEGILIEIGRVPNTEVFKGLVEMNKHGHIIADIETNTSVPGIFAAGDCATGGHEYQYVIAAGQGCMALLKAARYLAKKKV